VVTILGVLLILLPQLAISQSTSPLKSLKLNSGFGIRKHPLTGRETFHSGIDLAARRDTVFCFLAGKVIAISYSKGLGIHLTIAHSGELKTVYGHLSLVFLTPGDTVELGQPLGITGASGKVTGEHLHFEVRYQSVPLNPVQFLYRLNFGSAGPNPTLFFWNHDKRTSGSLTYKEAAPAS